MTIGIAVLGAGIFAREEHIPAIQACDLVTLKAVYSRSQKSADALATSVDPKPDSYYDDPSSADKSLDALLARNDIQAVVVALPILNQPAVIKKAIAAGKHVLSEKPIAKDTATAKELLEWYGSLSSPPIWGVGENFRFLDSVVYATEQLKEIGGDVVTFGFEMFNLIKDEDKYFNTQWRKVPEYQGGFLLDGGVHFVAGVRYFLAAVGQEVKQLSARTALLQEKLPPVDTVHGLLTTGSGRSGTFICSFGTEFKSGFTIELVTTNGAVRMSPVEVTVTKRGANGEKTEEKKDFEFNTGVKAELVAFAQSINAGEVDPRQTAEQAFKDLEILQALLESGEASGAIKTF
ncbi:hypothetical protein jhhlp_007870 [Lomentospora prolificans]|uniref:Gfo/Idh/MocA-like oxidoreductase N-terminal domain-containing protein n=1 Tax=Lomentospora prolificans TaxID=41688 RepID=A0A2N3N0S5_9PEZI|nr:hypothetical protein jhhlp_007870 [Lomentospora prolificans]